ncbi:hypothetical protein NM688_g787 [Phlebia brevispora]|uniref:Uncharacterized protein n=1 Tax=Phlebia brevispora TaxID=194682 RepID=A0ACC1TDK6_9APHY|nr:hypothetical protein NM688_g787 [Phlebia brevispora]
MGIVKAIAVLLHLAGAAVMTYAWMELDQVPNNAWVVKQKGGHFQFLTIQGLFAAWATMALSLIADFTSWGLFRRLKRALFMIAMPLAAVISTIYWGLLLLMPSLILRPNNIEEYDPASTAKASDDLARIPLELDLALHAVPGTVLLIDFFLFERKYSKKYARYGGAAVATLAGIWYAWWVEYCASFNGVFPYPFLTYSPFPKLWGGRFTGKTDPVMHEFNQSLRYDKRMHAADIKGSIAYAKALTKVGILTPDEEQKIVEGLQKVEQEWAGGEFKIMPDDEDIHTANERRLTELIGKLGGKLHTGRSRNDQVATDMRLWLLDEVKEVEEGLKALIRVMVERADKEKEFLLPGYTHLQRGQPIRWAHLLLSHAFSFSADLQRLQQLIPRVSVLPLGCGALAGNPFVVDREFLAKELGFQSVAENSLYGVGDRDFIVEFMMWASLAMTHISRMAEDLVIYSTAEFGFVTLSDAYSTGSSIMPQKKNPDSLELLRGKSGRVFGNMAGFLMTLKGLPSTYNKDLQEDKEPLFDAVDTVSASFKIAEGVVATMEVHADKMRQALTMDVLATDLADYLVRKGIPFRKTHEISGKAVALAESRGCQLNELSLSDFKGLNSEFSDDIHSIFNFEASVERRESIGGTSLKMVERQISVLRGLLV